jgi:hypothetical protein
MPRAVQQARIVRFEDRLHFAYILGSMKRAYQFVRALGEIRYHGLPDNSQSEYYQSRNQTLADNAFVNAEIARRFNRVPR